MDPNRISVSGNIIGVVAQWKMRDQAGWLSRASEEDDQDHDQDDPACNCRVHPPGDLLPPGNLRLRLRWFRHFEGYFRSHHVAIVRVQHVQRIQVESVLSRSGAGWRLDFYGVLAGLSGSVVALHLPFQG
jgi:hypothetical protein